MRSPRTVGIPTKYRALIIQEQQRLGTSTQGTMGVILEHYFSAGAGPASVEQPDPPAIVEQPPPEAGVAVELEEGGVIHVIEDD